ncbi:hypothetical protein VTJ83DRAFT_7397 [Remersonia thermophila]|uniref:Uncharacterized protein n=1 Tax=Remersonia thermophila TaxID=72144 RepID=A0ABR4D5Q6_9PEZI
MTHEIPPGQQQQQQQQWILALSLAALLFALIIFTAVLAPVASRHAKAYLDAPSEIAAFLDAVDSSVVENESYDRDVARLRRLEDRVRLGRLLREIQRGGDALREELNALVIADDGDRRQPRLRDAARFWWASHRERLQEKVRRLDLLRMRFLVVHMGIIAAAATAAAAESADTAAATPVVRTGRDDRERDQGRVPAAPHDPEKSPTFPPTPPRGGNGLPRALADSIRARPPPRRLAVDAGTAVAHPDNVEPKQRKGWAGVVMELQKSPLLRERHASIEMAMSRASSAPRNPALPRMAPAVGERDS